MDISFPLGTAISILRLFVPPLAQKPYRWFTNRATRWFWAPFLREPLTMVYTDYPVSGSDELSQIARVAGDGHLLSSGMAMALLTLIRHLSDSGRIGMYRVQGANVRNELVGHVITLGSEVSNSVTKALCDEIGGHYAFQYQIVWNRADTAIRLHVLQRPDSTAFNDEPTSDSWYDHARIVRAVCSDAPAKRWVLMISGRYMWGTEAAARAVVSEAILREVRNRTNYAENVVFIIRTHVINGIASSPELVEARQL